MALRVLSKKFDSLPSYDAKIPFEEMSAEELSFAEQATEKDPH